ncbi:MAG: DNA repair exonuclease [archaeon]
MKFAHLADCHIGGWREPKLRALSFEAFEQAVDYSISNNVDFILISGDLFNTSMPELEMLKETVKKLKMLQEKNIPVYAIAGSHDFSPSGKTMLEVLEEAGLCVNVVKGAVENKKLKLHFTIDKKTGAKITGMIGKRGMLERSFYENLERSSLEKESGFKIFMFHTALTELKPKELEKMDSAPISYLPKNFNYYAGGHVHIVRKESFPGYENIIYPGPLFPNSFRELEELECGGFYLYSDEIIEYISIKIKEIHKIKIDANNKAPESVTEDCLTHIKSKEVKDKIVLLRVEGILSSGKASDVDFRKIYEKAMENGAYLIVRNTYSLKSKDFEEIMVKESTIEEIEESLIKEHIGQFKVNSWDTQKEALIIKELVNALSSEKKEGEKSYDYEERIKKEAGKILGIRE